MLYTTRPQLIQVIICTDRPLQHINKKGRPVSQCHHCRTMRKSRSAHIKCDCGEKTSKCAHLQQPVEGHKGMILTSSFLSILESVRLNGVACRKLLHYCNDGLLTLTDRNLLLQPWWALYLCLQKRVVPGHRSGG